jgi:hypothetical protein
MKHESFDRDKFHVITMISNPARFSRRYELYQQFAKEMAKAEVNFWTVELQLGDRPFAITDCKNPRHIQLRHWDELWHKENALNIGVAKLPDDWETVAWIDADTEFLRPDWVNETLNQLQVYKIVQMFDTAIDMGPTGEVLSVHKSFMGQYIKGGAIHPEQAYHEMHPGYCWAARREAIDDMGGLYDKAILGAGDRHMALAFVGKAQLSFHPDTTSEYQRSIMDFQDRCEKSIRRDVGYVNGTVRHHWHGKKKDRRYWDRWQILVKNNYRPNSDIKRNSYGVYQLHDDGSDRFLRLRDEIRAYNRQRNENSIDLE